MTDQALLRTTLLAHLLDEDLTPSSYVDFQHFTVHRGSQVTDALVQQVCAFNPGILFINLENCCNNVTDLGILAIATFCHNLEKIKLSDCCKLTHVGVRALALNCPQLKTVSFKRCSKIDDRSLRIIAANIRCLEELELEGCMQISDCGVAEIAQWCVRLRLVNLSSCVKVGEFGDKSLRMMGLKSHMLNHLDLTDCANISDGALKSLSIGCRELNTLKLSGCALLTGNAVQKFVSSFRNLAVLTLNNCPKIKDTDLARLSQSCQLLKRINVSCSPAVTLRSLEAILMNCSKLEELDMSENSQLDDYILDTITKVEVKLWKLILQKCHSITEKGVENLVFSAHHLLHLDLTGCQNIQPLFMYRIALYMPFSNVSQVFLGFEPKSNAKELIQHHEDVKQKNDSLLLLQRVIRGFLSRVGEIHTIQSRRRVSLVIPLVQALSRGFIVRQRYTEVLKIVKANQSAAVFQLHWRHCRDRCNLNKILKDRISLKRMHSSSARVQRVYRGYFYGRRIAREAKDERFRDELDAVKKIVQQRIACIVLQNCLKYAHARKKLKHYREMKRVQIEQFGIICRNATLIQKKSRIWRSQRIVNILREEKTRQNLRVRKATTIQLTLRRLKIELHERERLLKSSALAIQSYWRHHRSNLMFSQFQARAAEMNRQKKSAVQTLQRLARSKAARSFVQRGLLMQVKWLVSTAAGQKIQRVIRCYLSREKLNVLRDSAYIERKIKVLFPTFQESTNELHATNSKILAVTASVALSEKEISQMEREMQLMSDNGSKYWDSDRISGTPQRFLTGVLYAQMKQILNQAYINIESERDTLSNLMTQRDELTRATEFLVSEMSYLNTVALEKAKQKRSNELKAESHRNEWHCVNKDADM